MVLSLSVRCLVVVLLVSAPLHCLAETVLLDFSAPSCGPCQKMRPVVERLVADGLPVREIDVTREPQLAARFGVTEVPTFLVVVDGNPVDQVVGETSYRHLHRILRRAMPAPAPRQRAIPFGQSPDQQSPNSHHQQLLAATVKITVDDAEGKSAGTGTIVDARSGEALILTCGHLFRSSAGKGTITVTTFQAGPADAIAGASFVGRLIDFDLERDLALVSVRPTAPVTTISIAGTTVNPLRANEAVTSVGCNHGQNPTAIDSRVTAIDRYQGTSNVEVAGAPVEGRSGGGLFNAAGQLVGVCYAADPQGNEGLYAALPAIYAKLDSLNLSVIYQKQAAGPQVAQAAAVNVAPQAIPEQPPSSVRGQEPEAPGLFANTQALPPAELAALEEIQQRGVNSEVICIIRPQDPTAKSEVITLNNVSPAFVQALANPRTRQPSAAAAAGELLR